MLEDSRLVEAGDGESPVMALQHWKILRQNMPNINIQYIVALYLI